jgi:hypothetical protein
MRRDPTRNQSEAGAPQTSRTGRALEASADELWGAPTYLPRARVGILGRFGDYGARDYVSTPIVARRGYQGLAPLSLQPEFTPPPPWETGGIRGG